MTQYVAAALDPATLELAKFDICAHTERDLRRRLGDGPGLRVWWEAELPQRDADGFRVLAPWTPGKPLPAGTWLVRCVAATAPDTPDGSL